MKNNVLVRSSTQVVITEVIFVNYNAAKMFYLKFCSIAKQVYYLIAFLITRPGCLLFTFLGQLLFQAAFTIAMQLRFISVLTKFFGNKVFIGIVLCHYHYLAEGL